MNKQYPMFRCCSNDPKYVVPYTDGDCITIWHVCDRHIPEEAFRNAAKLPAIASDIQSVSVFPKD